jgi:uncharacterized protein YcbK (DUF882 family)
MISRIGQDLMVRNHEAVEEFNADRRGFLRRGLGMGMVAALGLSMLPGEAFANGAAHAVMAGREISMFNAHTGEKFTGTYWQNGRYLPDAFSGIKGVMRDHRSGETFPIDPRLMDILYVIQNKLGNHEGFRVLSGYRSPKSNAMLRRSGEGVAKQSLHMTGQAIDVSLPGTKLSSLHKMALNVHSGGVGFYPKTGFVHIDTGRVRSW